MSLEARITECPLCGSPLQFRHSHLVNLNGATVVRRIDNGRAEWFEFYESDVDFEQHSEGFSCMSGCDEEAMLDALDLEKGVEV